MKSQKIILVTDGFPRVKEVEIFLKNEFDSLLSLKVGVQLITDVSSSIKDHNSNETYFYKRSLSFLILAILSPLFWNELFFEKKRSGKINIKKIKIALDFLANALHFKKYVRNRASNVFYTYWMTAKTLGACMNNSIVYSRVHGYDVYYERHPEEYLPFRNYMLQKVKKIGVISLKGKNYIEGKFPQSKDKLQVRRLGVKIPDSFLVNNESEYFHIVTCSSLIALKQIHLLIEALKKMTKKIEWTHFGAGPLELKLKNQAKYLPSNVTVNWKGFCKNEDVLSCFESKKPDLFINVSSTEGIPVSLMEAYAYSIPAIAPDVGGIKEIFYNDKYLLSKQFKVEELVDKLNHFINLSKDDQSLMRRKVYEFAIKKLSSNVLYKDWHEEIIKSL